MKNIIKKGMFAVAALFVSALSFAQDANAADTAFSTYMDGLQTSISDKVVSMLPVLGQVAGIALIIFLAMFVFRKVKSFMTRS